MSKVFAICYGVYNYTEKVTDILIICEEPNKAYEKLYTLRYEKYVHTKGVMRLDDKCIV